MTQDQEANEQEARGAQQLLDCFLENYLGPRLVVQLKCYESADHNPKTLNKVLPCLCRISNGSQLMVYSCLEHGSPAFRSSIIIFGTLHLT